MINLMGLRMNTVYLIYTCYYDFNNDKPTIGGVQTYIEGLCTVFNEIGYLCKIYQTGNKYLQKVIGENVNVYQIDTSNIKDNNKKVQKVTDEISKIYNDNTDILIFLANELICKNNATNSIALQHGISWDYLYDKPLSKIRTAIHSFIKAKNSFQIIERLSGVKNLVCVDHNFPNWLRATAIKCDTPCIVIPNFTEIAPIYKKPEDRVNIIFARRFFSYRGTRIFAPAIKNILSKYSNVFVTIAGTGPDKDYLKDMLKDYDNRVKFINYSAKESLGVHSKQHIAVVPTIGSEGTSLSLLEAMAAQCAVVSTDAGGLSNIIIDGYNGLYCDRNEEDLETKIAYLVENTQIRENIARRAYEVVKEGFSFEKWKKRWIEVINNITGECK